MPKVEKLMPKSLEPIRVYLDPQANLTIGRLADLEGRTKQRQMGLILEAVARMFDQDPHKLESLGLLSKLALAAA